MDVMNTRRKDIVSFVNQKGSVSFQELKEQFPSVSDMTLRTDLKYLDQNRLLIRIHGGAKSLDTISGNDDYLSRRFIKNTSEKKEIAKKAITLALENKTIFIDSGSTTTYFSQLFPDQKNIIYTSGLTCAIELSKLSKPKVCITGGMINSNSLSVNGFIGIDYLKNVNFDIAFMGVTRFSPRTGFTCESSEDADLKRAVIGKAEKVVVFMDSSKININGTYTICDLKDIDVLVSDSKLPEDFLEECKTQGVMVL
ncbi:MAG: DeoR/GlpR family DNA-binding transcription regulator [Bacillota bacterium]|nr:DeoR/GlpR family DNA-binding transcription regulator [Bacillota bacterium]